MYRLKVQVAISRISATSGIVMIDFMRVLLGCPKARLQKNFSPIFPDEIQPPTLTSAPQR